MAQKKITELPYANSIDNDDVFPIVQDGVTKQIEFTNLKDPLVDEVRSNLNFLQFGKECIVGNWIDGRYIYRRILSVDSFSYRESGSDTHVGYTFKCSFGGTVSDFFDIILSSDLIYQMNDTYRQKHSLRLNIMNYSKTNTTCDFACFHEEVVVDMLSAQYESGTPLYIIIDYVKAV